MNEQQPIYISRADLLQIRARLNLIAEGRHDRENLARLRAEFDRALIIEDDTAMPDGVVTLHCEVRLQDLDTNEIETYTLTLPEHADPEAHRISILAPIGTALLGYQVDNVVTWEMPGGARRLRILEARRQPRPVVPAMTLSGLGFNHS
ncbi:transcription elongation factor GreAB [Opitutaceae bacterium TAV4]|uniref:GreA/GreB family elongation factor n=1 Tax=Geminisphaera colitermitum TaxID=1148786 RepID=UPI0001965451|nr:GreA/GreB family elongation factor [Geminisphaera colitermitum]RRJ95466.1 transcription elongation factor GreAB [Opitutaceae bacterium TAV4]RRJ99644.1 transcription elongation factor GreAB [Opitutaceae bacterium TAV3]